MSVLEGARPDNKTVLASNLTSSSVNKNEDRHVERRGPLTFDPSPPLDDNDQVDLIAADKQSKLMRWHHCLGHLSFAKIKALALAGKIPKKLAKSQATRLCRLPLRRHDKGKLERKGGCPWPPSLCSNKTRSVHLC
jgi:hypothetical protein